MKWCQNMVGHRHTGKTTAARIRDPTGTQVSLSLEERNGNLPGTAIHSVLVKTKNCQHVG